MSHDFQIEHSSVILSIKKHQINNSNRTAAFQLMKLPPMFDFMKYQCMMMPWS